MKKIMAFAACLLLAAVTHGAAVGWTIGGATDFKSGGYNVFVLGQNGVTSVDQITALLVSDGVEALSSYAWANGSVTTAGAVNAAATSSGKSFEYSGSGTDSYTAFAVIWDSAKENASWTSTATITMSNNSTSKTFLFGNQAGNLTTNKTPYNGSGVPEPTSGLLLLVGGAMLALRRKQK